MKEDLEYDKMMDMLASSILAKMTPEELQSLMDVKTLGDMGLIANVLDELIDLEDKASPSELMLCDNNLPQYMDFWNDDFNGDLCAKYDLLKKECKNKVSKQLTADINRFLNSIPYNYRNLDNILDSTTMWMIADIITSHNLTGCYSAYIKTLTYCNEFISDVYMDDEAGSISLFAELGHSNIDEFVQIATNEKVMPFARGIAIGAIAQSVEHQPKRRDFIVEQITSVFDYYAGIATSRNTAPKLLVKAIAMIAARFQFTELLPKITSVYKRLRVSTKAYGNLTFVESIMRHDKHVNFNSGRSISTHLNDFLNFQQRFDLSSLADDFSDGEKDSWDFDDEEWDEEKDDVYQYENITIYQREISYAHPKGMPSFTDGAYTQFANELVGVIKDLRIADISSKEVKSLALKSALYFEDVLADAGIWRSFVDRMREMYGKPLPFYKVDEEDYYPDEPNFQDVLLLVWMTRCDINDEKIPNPENPALVHVASAIYDYMMLMFDVVPVNEQLKKYFTEAKFMNSFVEARDAIKWAYLCCYLTATNKAQKALDEMSEDFKPIYKKEAYYAAESTIIYKERIGPLALCASEWVAMILDANGRNKEADVVRNITFADGFFHVEKREDDIFTIRNTKGELMTMERKNFGKKVSAQLFEDYFYTCLAKFDGKWYMSGSALWSTGLNESYYDECGRQESYKNIGVPNYDKFLEKSGGLPFICFKTKKEAGKFMKEELGLSDVASAKLLSLGTPKDTMTMFAPSDKEGIIYIPGLAECIKSPENPYFNTKIAKENSLAMALNLPYVLFFYMMKHGYFPFAGLNHIKGQKEGIRQFQENFDFIYRFINPTGLKKPWE